MTCHDTIMMACHDTIVKWWGMMWYHHELNQSSPHIEAARPGCACAFGGLLSFVWHPAAISGPRHQKKNIITISTYSISTMVNAPHFVAIMPGQARPYFSMALRLLATLLLCCVFVSFIHSFGSSFPHYACRPTYNWIMGNKPNDPQPKNHRRVTRWATQHRSFVTQIFNA